MPLLARTVTELPTHVFDPVIRQSLDRVLSTLSFRERIGDKIYISTDYSTHSKTSDKNKNAIIEEEGLRVTANVQMNPYSQKWEGYTFHHNTAYGIDLRALNENAPIYIDRENRVRIVELQGPASISMDCELTLNSRAVAYQTPSQLFNRYGTGDIVEYQDMFFDYPVPRPMLELIFHLWSIDRIKGKPAGIPFVAYLQYHTEEHRGANDGWQIVMNRHHSAANQDREVVIPVARVKAYTSLEYQDDRPQPITNNRVTVGYKIPFGISVQFSIPTVLLMQYPVIYNNQLLDPKFIPTDLSSPRHNMGAAHHLHATHQHDLTHNPKVVSHIQSPVYDDWVPPTQTAIAGYDLRTYWIIAATIDETEDGYVAETTTLNLGEDFDTAYAIQPCVKDLMMLQGPGTIEYDSIYNVQLYRGDKLLRPHEDFTWDADNLSLIFKPVDAQSIYHVVLTHATHLSRISSKYHKVMLEYFFCLPECIKNQIRNDESWHGKWPGTDGNLHPGGHRQPPSIDDDGNLRDDFGDIIGDITSGGKTDGTDTYNSSRVWYNIIRAKRPTTPSK